MNAPVSIPTAEQMLVEVAHSHVRAARNHLLAATIILDDAGLFDDDVSRAAGRRTVVA